MIHVCHIIAGDLWAGAEVMTYNLLKELNKTSGLKLSAILFNEGILAAKIRQLNIPVTVYDESKLSFFKLVKKVKANISAHEYEIIHSHNYKENILVSLIKPFLKSVYVVGTQHGMPEMFSGMKKVKYNFLMNINFRLVSAVFDKLIAVSHDLKNRLLEKFPLNEKKVMVIHNGIGLSNHNKFNKKDKFVIGSAGRFVPVKDFPLFIEIAKKVIEKESGISFELIGEGPDFNKIQNLVEEFGLNQKVKIRGFLEKIDEFYNSIDIFLNTSFHEGIPMSILEAQAFSKPVIAPFVGGIPEIVFDSQNGFLIENRDPQKFAEKCLFLYHHRDKLTKMGEIASKKITTNFSIASTAVKYNNLYKKLCDSHLNR